MQSNDAKVPGMCASKIAHDVVGVDLKDEMQANVYAIHICCVNVNQGKNMVFAEYFANGKSRYNYRNVQNGNKSIQFNF